MCVLRQDFPRAEPKDQRLEEIYGVSVLGCSSSARTASETSLKGDGEVLRSTAYRNWMCVIRQDFPRNK